MLPNMAETARRMRDDLYPPWFSWLVSLYQPVHLTPRRIVVENPNTGHGTACSEAISTVFLDPSIAYTATSQNQA